MSKKKKNKVPKPKPEKTEEEKRTYTVTKKLGKVLKVLRAMYSEKMATAQISKYFNNNIVQQVCFGLGYPNAKLTDDQKEYIVKVCITPTTNIFDEYLKQNIDNPYENVRVKIGCLLVLLISKYNVKFDDLHFNFGNKKNIKRKELLRKIQIAVRRVVTDSGHLDEVEEFMDPGGYRRAEIKKRREEYEARVLDEKLHGQERHDRDEVRHALKLLMKHSKNLDFVKQILDNGELSYEDLKKEEDRTKNDARERTNKAKEEKHERDRQHEEMLKNMPPIAHNKPIETGFDF